MSAEKIDGFPTTEKRTGKKCPPKIATTLMKFSIGKLQRTAFARLSPKIFHTHVHPSRTNLAYITLRDKGRARIPKCRCKLSLQANLGFHSGSICEPRQLGGDLAAVGVSGHSQ